MQLASLDLALLRRHKPPCHTAVVEEASGWVHVRPGPPWVCWQPLHAKTEAGASVPSPPLV